MTRAQARQLARRLRHVTVLRFAGEDSRSAAGVIGPENLLKPAIADAIAATQAERSKRTAVTADMVVAQLAANA